MSPLRRAPVLLALAVLTTATVSLAAQQQSAPPRSAGEAGLGERALVPLDVRPSPGFARAVQRGTRSADGRPGSRYWQQAVEYDLRAVVDPATRLLRGDETVTYTNHSPDTLSQVVFHLYQNLFTARAPKGRPVPVTGGTTLERLAVGDLELPLPSQGDSVTGTPDTTAPVLIDGTVMRVRLPRSLLPGAKTTFSVAWRFTIPEGDGVPRMGMADSTTGLVAQWYPQVATYDDLNGWDTRPYLSNGEFYLEYGDFKLAVTVPAGTVVAATGDLVNADEVLPGAVRERLDQALRGQEVVHVLTESDFGPGAATRGRPGRRITWRFEAENVRDVAFAFSDHYLWDATAAVGAPRREGRGALRTAVHALYRPDAANWRDAAAMTKDAIETFSRNVHAYVYPHITSAEGLVGGMEYPMIVFVRNYDTAQRTERVIAHEVGHEWFPMMVGSDETAYPWMDEGVNTFITIFATEHYDPSSPERGEVRERYRKYTLETQRFFSLMDPPDAVASGGGEVAVLGYRKPATALLALREILGAETFDRALSEYARRWLFKHPAPWDFFRTFADVSGRDLDWFWQPWFYGSGVSDLAIGDVRLEPAEAEEAPGPASAASQATGSRDTGPTARRLVTVTVRNEGTVLSPVRLRITSTTGDTLRLGAPASVWFDGSRATELSAELTGEPAKVELDPEGLFADVDASDDVWIPGGGTAADSISAAAPSLRQSDGAGSTPAGRGR